MFGMKNKIFPQVLSLIDKYFIISNSENWNDEIQKCDECNYFETDKQAQEYKKAEQYE